MKEKDTVHFPSHLCQFGLHLFKKWTHSKSQRLLVHTSHMLVKAVILFSVYALQSVTLLVSFCLFGIYTLTVDACVVSDVYRLHLI